MLLPSPFEIYLVWHPSSESGRDLAGKIHRHFAGSRYRRIAGDTGVGVRYRNAGAHGAPPREPIDWRGADVTAVVALIDGEFSNDAAWIEYIHRLAEEARKIGFGSRLFPVFVDKSALKIDLEEQALRWDTWLEQDIDREERLIVELTYEFCRMLRYRWMRLQCPEIGAHQADSYLKKVSVFLSHSKHDDRGEKIAKITRDWLHENSALASFFDVHDIPSGVSFSNVIAKSIKESILLAIRTDSYSSREWCCREVIEAKRADIPMLVVDCLETIDERTFPYLGNVPTIRMNPDSCSELGQVTLYLIDEVFKSFLWQCRVEHFRAVYPQVLFLSRAPELISLTGVQQRTSGQWRSIVHPDPPLRSEELRLFSDIAHDVNVSSVTEWMAENVT